MTPVLLEVTLGIMVEIFHTDSQTNDGCHEEDFLAANVFTGVKNNQEPVRKPP